MSQFRLAFVARTNLSKHVVATNTACPWTCGATTARTMSHVGYAARRSMMGTKRRGTPTHASQRSQPWCTACKRQSPASPGQSARGKSESPWEGPSRWSSACPSSHGTRSRTRPRRNWLSTLPPPSNLSLKKHLTLSVWQIRQYLFQCCCPIFLPWK